MFGVALLLAASSLRAQGPAPKAGGTGDLVLRDALVIRPVGRYGRNALHTDAIEARIVAGDLSAPKEGDTVTLPDGTTRTWEAATAGADGGFQNPALGGGYAFLPVSVPSEGVWVLEASGHNLVYVNGVLRVGDPYGTGYVRLPVQLQAGANALLFQVSRGRLRAKLTPPAAFALINAADATLPDLIAGEKIDAWGAVVVMNATNAPADDLSLEASWPGGKTTRTPVPPILPLGTRKAAFSLTGTAPREGKERVVTLTLVQRANGRRRVLHSLPVTLRVRQAGESRKRTFRSAIDGSVQYYAVQPARRLPGDTARPALFLTLHGASVEAIGQADAYAPKTWGHLVAPTNRRPYGFDWEDWGRLDALEVLGIAAQTLGTDPHRVYLTGHSMGGHGTWILGATFPDRFAAIGPSAGWISFATYGGARRASEENPSPVQALLERAASPSDTLSLLPNYAQEGIYILHGDADDNVPVTEAREMRRRLAAFHHDFDFHEEPGAGHWWDNGATPGAECVDWAPMFDLFAHHRLPDDESVRQVDFVTASPGVSAWSHWAGIAAQIRPFVPSAVHLRCDPIARRVTGTTDNVARLCLRLDGLTPGEPITVTLDGTELAPIPWPTAKKTAPPIVWLAREGDVWKPIAEPSPNEKNPARYGPFKDAFRHRMIFVYGTNGTPDENAWALAKARYDAETFWYRGNGAIDVVSDRQFDARREPDRNVILYGNADTNGAWVALLSGSPVQVRRGAVQVGDRTLRGDNLACLFLRPRPGSDVACVAVVAGSGMAGMRLTDRMPYFTSGVAYPDGIVLDPTTLREGASGVRVAGFFGLDWGVATGEFAGPEAPGR